VRAYAEAFCAGPRDAAELADEALDRAAGWEGPALRPALLAEVRRAAYGRLRTGWAGRLSPGFLQWSRRAAVAFGETDTLGRVEQSSLLLRAFEELPDSARTALWHVLAEERSTDLAAALLGTTEDFAVASAHAARDRLIETYRRLRAERTAEAACVHYGGMISAVSRGTHANAPADLEQHMAGCRFCAHDYTVLHTLAADEESDVRTLLVAQVLLWGGTAYQDALRRQYTVPGPDEPPVEPPAPHEPVRRRGTLLYTVVATVVVTAAATTAVLKLGSGSEAAASDRPSAVAPSAPSASPSPSPSASAATATITLRSRATGRCLAVPGGSASWDVDPAQAVCDGSASQRWRVVVTKGKSVALQNVATKLCLDIAGDRRAGDGMQQRPCAYSQGANAPYPEDQAFLLKATASGDYVTLLCQDNPRIALGARPGGIGMLTAAGAGSAVRFVRADASTT